MIGFVILQWIGIVAVAILIGLPVYALPATMTLPRGRRPGVQPLTLQQAAEQLLESGLSGRNLVEAARTLVAERMVYCRRNSFDHYSRAFERGYGYCQQQAFALAYLLTRLGIQADVVQAVRNRFDRGMVSGHAWVEVNFDGQSFFIDSIAYDSELQHITFTPLTKVTRYTPFFRLLAGWGSAAVNAHRYYLTGKDH